MTITVRLALVAAIASIALQPGCATLTAAEKNLPVIIADVNEAVLVVSTIKTFVDGYFANHPSPSSQSAVDQAFARVDLAANAVLAIGRAAGDLQGSQGIAALSELESAYNDVLALVKTFGVSTAASGARMAAAGGGLVVPAARDLRLMALRKS